MDNLPKNFNRISFQAWLALFSLGLFLWIVITHFGLILEILWIIFGATLLTLAIRPLATFFNRWHVPRGITVLAVYAGIGGLFFVMGNLLSPALTAEADTLRTNAPTIVEHLIPQIRGLPLIGNLLPTSGNLVQNIIQRLDTVLSPLVNALAGLGSLALDALIVLVLAFFFVTDTNLSLTNLVDQWLPKRYWKHTSIILDRLSRRLTRWIWAQSAIALYFALAFSLGLMLLKVPYALTIGLIGGLLEIIPYLGGAVALFLAIFSALTVNTSLVLWVFLLYLVVVEIESHIIGPIFYGRVIGLNPAAVLIILVVGVKASGVVGALLAVPVAVVLLAFLQEARYLLQSTSDHTGIVLPENPEQNLHQPDNPN